MIMQITGLSKLLSTFKFSAKMSKSEDGFKIASIHLP